MKKWMSGIRGTAVMILLWIVGWAVGFGGLIEAFIDPDGKILDIWPTFLAVPGFVGGIVFSALLTIAERGRSFDEVSFGRFAVSGVLTGLVIGVLTIPAKVGEVSPGAAGMIGLATALSLVAAIGSAVFFRLVARDRTSKVAT